MAVAVQKPRFFYRPSGIVLDHTIGRRFMDVVPGESGDTRLDSGGYHISVWSKETDLGHGRFYGFSVNHHQLHGLYTCSHDQLRLLLLLLIGIIIWRSRVYNQIELGARAKRVIIPVLILVGLSIVSNLIFTGFDNAFKDFRNMLVGILIIIFFPAIIRNLKEFKTLCAVVFIGIAASADSRSNAALSVFRNRSKYPYSRFSQTVGRPAQGTRHGRNRARAVLYPLHCHYGRFGYKSYQRHNQQQSSG